MLAWQKPFTTVHQGNNGLFYIHMFKWNDEKHSFDPFHWPMPYLSYVQARKIACEKEMPYCPMGNNPYLLNKRIE